MRRLAATLDTIGGVTKRPPIWAVVGGALVAKGGPRGRVAALQGGVSYAVAAVLANLVIKPIVHRTRPPGSEQARIGPLTSSFPSGHAATDLAFIFGVSQRVPALFPPLAAATIAAHWSLVRSRAHYVSDILAGGALGIGVALAVGAVWPKDDQPSPTSDSTGPKGNDDLRVMTQVDGQEAQLLVHIERTADDATPATPLPE